MKTLQFEGVKVALKQDKTGYVLTLSMHPDDIPVFRSFSRCCRNIFDEDMEDATEWVRNYLNVPSRSDLKTNREAQILLDRLHREFQEWTQKN